MGFKFRKSVKIAPGVKLNFGKKSTGISIGNKGGGISFNTKSGVRTRASIPGAGISYSSKLSSSTKKSNHKQGGQYSVTSQGSAGAPPIKLCPIPRKAWYIAIAALLVVSGLAYLGTDISAGLLTVAIGAVMLFFTYRSPKKINIDIQQFNRQLQIFDESINLFMGTSSTETFFGRYRDAEIAAEAMAAMTDAPILHDEPPQEAVAMLEREKTIATNAFLDRFAKDIRTKAFQLTRGRKAKIESFKLITGEYEDQMTSDSIEYRDNLYREMLSKIDELENT